MCQRSAKFLAEPSFFSTTVHDPAEIRRAFSGLHGDEKGSNYLRLAHLSQSASASLSRWSHDSHPFLLAVLL
ncbi:hypothetical protein Q1695_011933 [Nippostrongylus brasiliensis]|nr:hypothetical protein Q1695_011933 [Nippostrongylus brasiliensis]